MNHLNELKGQPKALAILQSYTLRRPPPLLLLSGPSGTGKFSAARAFAQIQLCETRSGCGQCAACTRFLRGEHPDYIQFPEGRVRIGDPQKPEQYTIRWLLQTRMPYRPHEGGQRIVLIPDASEIQNEAETALLKTLEEPPEHTRFIFITPDHSFLKPTIVSRAVLVPFGLLSTEALAEITGAAPEILELLGGSLEGIALLQSPLFQEIRERLARLRAPIDILELEAWISKKEKELKDELSADELWESLTLAWIYELRKEPARHMQELNALFDLKESLHARMPGFLPYATSLFMHRMGELVQAPGA